MTTFVALLRRELWEHRSLVIVPGALAALIIASIVGSSVYGLVHGGLVIMVGGSIVDAVPQEHAGQVIPALYLGMLVCFGMVLSVSIPLYLVDCLYADRRDRSILFWKSLPISDAETVVSKLTTGLLLAPAVALVAAFVTTFVLSIGGSIVMWAAGISGVGTLWQLKPLLNITLGAPLLAVLLALWYAPVAAWCVLASAYAPRAPLMWATLPPIALIIAEQVAFRTTRVPEFLGDRLGGVFSRLFDASDFRGFGVHDGSLEGGLPALRDVTAYLTSIDLWGGLVAAALFVLAAIALRRYRDET
jgi:ABC-2 type transport system permease protein